ncbi:thioredoxin domain-containing protein [Streptococcaceae bacterium ESL0687]|nr:thioredoxin domain-containing protein [Streptococcaceae bacterium ESL0687]
MDTSEIRVDKTNSVNGIHIGEEGKLMKEFINLACPFSRLWFEESENFLKKEVEEGRVRRLIKLFDKQKGHLVKGNIMHAFIDPLDPEKALRDIAKVFSSQEAWEPLDDEGIAEFAKNELGLSYHDDKRDAASIVKEAQEANVFFVPTVIMDDYIFDENIDKETLEEYIRS